MAEIRVLSDEEFYKMKKENKRKEFLKELEHMSKPVPDKTRKSFSVKDISSSESNDENTKDKKSVSDYVNNDMYTGDTDDSNWDEFVENLSNYDISPIESITDENITGFRLDPNIVDSNEDNKYSNVFKKELAMLSEVLKDVKDHGTRVNNALKKMNVGGKGNSSRVTGIPKGYSDLIEAYNSINTTKIQVIKTMSDLRSKQVDWQFKDKANSPTESESVDSIADSYYKKIISGGTKNFINQSMNSYEHSDFEYDTINDSQPSDMMGNEQEPDTSTIDSLAINNGFNITQPLRGSKSYMDTDIAGDEFGYIANEGNDYEVVAYQYGDNKFQLGALDKFGEVLDDVELPSDVNPDIVNSLKLRPGSNFVYDKYGRSYRVIEMGNVDISDVDDMEYPY